MRILTTALFLGLAPLPVAAQDTLPGPFAAFDGASDAVLADPHDLAFGPDGRLYVADKFGARIAVFDPDSLELIEMLGEGFLPGVHDISFGPDGRIAVAVTGASAVALYDNIPALNDAPLGGIRAPNSEGALLHSNGRLYAMASGIGTLIMLGPQGYLGSVDGHLGAHDVAEAPDGSIWIGDNRNRRLVRYSEDLKLLQIIDDTRFGFIGPRYLDVTDQGLLVVADQEAHRILLIDPDGRDGATLLGTLGDGSPGLGPNKFDDPEGVAIRGTQYFFADSDNNRIVRYSVILN